MDARQAWIERVVPVLGDGLRHHHITVEGGVAATLLLEMLAACRLEKAALVHRPQADDARWAPLVHGMTAQDWLHFKNPWDPCTLQPGPTNVCVTVTCGAMGSVLMHAVGRRVVITLPEADVWTALDLLWWGARVTRDVCLGRMPWRDAHWSLGDPRWPFTPRERLGMPLKEETAGRGHILVVGCGSLGSEAARVLQPNATRWTLVDGGVVSVFNPVRQWFGGEDVGRAKVDVLARRLGAPARGVRWNADATADEPAWEALLRQDRPDVVLLASGTHHHGALARVAWRLGIPQVAACCYPRARFFEVAVLDPRASTPCLECYRGHLSRGAAAPLPVSNEQAQFLYTHADDATRAQTWKDLVAEPATRLETVRAAWVAARCVAAVLSDQKPAWFETMMREGTTCLLGGHDVVPNEDGEPSHGVVTPGQVLRLGLPDLQRGVSDGPCPVCQAQPTVEAAPPADVGEEETLALLG